MNAVHREPDFENILKVLRCEKPSRPTLFEFFMNDVVYREAAGEPPAERTPLNTVRYLAKAYAACGYDYVNAQGCTLSFNPKSRKEKTRSPSMAAFALPIGNLLNGFSGRILPLLIFLS